jgi:hypothetical protein
MPVAPDPKDGSLPDSDDGFTDAFNQFAAGKEPPPAPDTGGSDDDGEPGDEGPEIGGHAPAPAATETPPPDGTPPGDAEPDGGGQPPDGDKAPDLWANAPDDLKAEYQKVLKERDEAQHKAQSDANRVAALSRKLSTLQAPASAPQEAPAKPTEAQAALDDKIKQLREDYGDIADPLIELIEAQKAELKTVRTVLTGLSEERQAQVIASEQQALEARHPDWRDIANSKDFSSWLEVQPDNIQRLATSWDARETSVALTLFKSESGMASGQTDEGGTPKPKANAATGARRSQQLDGGRDVGSRPAPAASDAPEDFDAAFKFYEQKRLAKEQQLHRSR